MTGLNSGTVVPQEKAKPEPESLFRNWLITWLKTANSVGKLKHHLISSHSWDSVPSFYLSFSQQQINQPRLTEAEIIIFLQNPFGQAIQPLADSEFSCKINLRQFLSCPACANTEKSYTALLTMVTQLLHTNVPITFQIFLLKSGCHRDSNPTLLPFSRTCFFKIYER